MYSKNKIVKNLIMVFAILIILIILLCSLGDISSILKILQTNANPIYFIIALFAVLLYCVFYQISLMVLIKNKHEKMAFADNYCIAGSEFFFSAITPFSSGGQPFQAYALKRKGMKLSDSTSCLLMSFIAYQIVLNVLATISIIMYYSKLSAEIDNFAWLIFIGFSVNLIVLVILILIGMTKFMGNFFIWIMELLCKIKFINKFIADKKVGFTQYIKETQEAFKEIKNAKLIWLWSLLSKAIALIIYYSIPYLAFLCINVNLGIDNYLYSIAITSFSLTISIWLPTPGASGGAELAFTTLFLVMLDTDDNKNIALSGMLIWRLLTYYLLIIYGMVLYLLFERRCKNEDRSIY